MRLITYFSDGILGEKIIEILTEKIISTGFSCKMCGDCCLSHEGQNLVIITPPEIREIMKKTSLEWEDLAEPYPEYIEENGVFFTFSWVLRRDQNCCIFFRDGKCSIYDSRPSICRTYPFMIAEGALYVSECRGIGSLINSKEAEKLANDLLLRRERERREEKLIEMAYNNKKLHKGSYYVIDSEGVKKIDG